MPADYVISRFPETRHRHAACVTRAVRFAERICRERGERLTQLRQQVLELVWGSHQPIKAYELMDRLRAVRSGVAPPTVYRTLDFLQARGLVHRIESLNAFVGCAAPDDHHEGQFLICRHCGAVAELSDARIVGLLVQRAADMGFTIDRGIIEIEGTCASCRPSA